MLVDNADGAPVDVDDDPDMDDWGSLSGDDGDAGSNCDADDDGNAGSNSDAEDDGDAGSNSEADDDAFMDDASSDNSDDGSSVADFETSSPSKRKVSGGSPSGGKKSKLRR